MNKPKDDHQHINFNLDPNKTPVYFADGYVIISSDQSLTLNFAQNVFNEDQKNVVSRIALTIDQAKALLKDLSDHIEKFEL